MSDFYKIIKLNFLPGCAAIEVNKTKKLNVK